MNEHTADIPLFRPMEGVTPLSYAGQELETDERVKVITDIYRTLTELGVAPKLAQQVDELAQELYPLMTLQYNRFPDNTDEDIEFQGRGVSFDVQTPFLGVQDVSVYLRGCGNIQFVSGDQDTHQYPGFPENLNAFFFDIGRQPRIWESQSIPTALMEFYNAAIVFAAHARENKWNDISEALRAGVVIPIGVGFDEGLTNHLESLLDNGVSTATTDDDRRAYSWEGNRQGFGYILEVVPSTRRLKTHASVSQLRHGKLVDRVRDPLVWKEIQTSMILNLRYAGAFLSPQSTHYQNVHWIVPGKTASMIYGDYADFSFWGIIQNTMRHWYSKIVHFIHKIIFVLPSCIRIYQITMGYLVLKNMKYRG